MRRSSMSGALLPATKTDAKRSSSPREQGAPADCHNSGAPTTPTTRALTFPEVFPPMQIGPKGSRLGPARMRSDNRGRPTDACPPKAVTHRLETTFRHSCFVVPRRTEAFTVRLLLVYTENPNLARPAVQATMAIAGLNVGARLGDRNG